MCVQYKGITVNGPLTCEGFTNGLDKTLANSPRPLALFLWWHTLDAVGNGSFHLNPFKFANPHVKSAHARFDHEPSATGELYDDLSIGSPGNTWQLSHTRLLYGLYKCLGALDSTLVVPDLDPDTFGKGFYLVAFRFGNNDLNASYQAVATPSANLAVVLRFARELDQPLGMFTMVTADHCWYYDSNRIVTANANT